MYCEYRYVKLYGAVLWNEERMRELIRMKIRKYFYSEYKKKLDERWKELGAVLEAQKERISRLSPEEQEEIRERNMEEIQRLMEDLMPLPSEAYTFINITKYELFCTLAKSCVHYARREYANLLVDVEGLSGCIIFVGEELNYTGDLKEFMQTLISAADEVHIRPSADVGGEGPTDIDGLAQVEYWFDFYQTIEKE